MTGETQLYDGFGTGAVYLEPDPRDYRLEQLPEVQARIPALPPSFDGLRPLVETIYNQGSRPSCVCESTCGMKSIQEKMDIRAWQVYDATECYGANGGTGSNGVDTRRVLDWCLGTGLRVNGTQKRYKIGSYAFAPRTPRLWRETLAAALVEVGPCVVATLLPNTFGWNSDGAPNPQMYHQMALVGWEGLDDTSYAIFLNSWGQGWGQGGFCRLTWLFLEQNNFQSGYVYAFTVMDHKDGNIDPNPPPPPPPPPPPVQKVTVIGTANGAFKDTVAIGQTLGIAQGGTLSVTEVKREGQPDPNPAPFRVVGYQGVESGNRVRAGLTFSVLVEQLPAGGVLLVDIGGLSAGVVERTSGVIHVRAPVVAVTGPVTVRVEGAVAQGPVLTVYTGDTNPTGLEIVHGIQRRVLFAGVKDGSRYAEAWITTSFDPAARRTLPTGNTYYPATWRIPADAIGRSVTLTAKLTDGREVTKTISVAADPAEAVWGPLPLV